MVEILCLLSSPGCTQAYISTPSFGDSLWGIPKLEKKSSYLLFIARFRDPKNGISLPRILELPDNRQEKDWKPRSCDCSEMPRTGWSRFKAQNLLPAIANAVFIVNPGILHKYVVRCVYLTNKCRICFSARNFASHGSRGSYRLFGP